MKSRRISVRIDEDQEKTLEWIIENTGGNITDAIRTVLDMITGNFTAEMIHRHYLELKKRDRGRPKEDSRI